MVRSSETSVYPRTVETHSWGAAAPSAVSLYSLADVKVSSCEQHEIRLQGFPESFRPRRAAASKRPDVDDISRRHFRTAEINSDSGSDSQTTTSLRVHARMQHGAECCFYASTQRQDCQRSAAQLRVHSCSMPSPRKNGKKRTQSRQQINTRYQVYEYQVLFVDRSSDRTYVLRVP